MRCQVCGKKKPLRADRRVTMHYRKGNPCMGVGAAPIEEDSAAIHSARDHWKVRADKFAAIFTDHRERRLNAPLEPWFWQAWHDASVESSRLDRRVMCVLREASR